MHFYPRFNCVNQQQRTFLLHSTPWLCPCLKYQGLFGAMEHQATEDDLQPAPSPPFKIPCSGIWNTTNKQKPHICMSDARTSFSILSCTAFWWLAKALEGFCETLCLACTYHAPGHEQTCVYREASRLSVALPAVLRRMSQKHFVSVYETQNSACHTFCVSVRKITRECAYAGAYLTLRAVPTKRWPAARD
jgi:hypothetical protein